MPRSKQCTQLCPVPASHWLEAHSVVASVANLLHCTYPDERLLSYEQHSKFKPKSRLLQWKYSRTFLYLELSSTKSDWIHRDKKVHNPVFSFIIIIYFFLLWLSFLQHRVHYECLMYIGVRNNIQCTEDNLKAKENDKL